jgi:hypothetical protein
LRPPLYAATQTEDRAESFRHRSSGELFHQGSIEWIPAEIVQRDATGPGPYPEEPAASGRLEGWLRLLMIRDPRAKRGPHRHEGYAIAAPKI